MRWKNARVDLTGVHRLDGPGVRTWLLYEGQSRRLIHRLGCPTHEQVSPGPEHIPRAWHSAPAFHLAPMPFAVQRRVLASLTGNAEPLCVDRSAPAESPRRPSAIGGRRWRTPMPSSRARTSCFWRRLTSTRERVLPRVASGPAQVHRVQAGCERRHSVRRPRRPLPSMASPDRRGSSIPPAPATPSRRALSPRTSRGFPYRPASTVASSVQASLSRLRERRRCSRRHAPMPTARISQLSAAGAGS